MHKIKLSENVVELKIFLLLQHFKVVNSSLLSFPLFEQSLSRTPYGGIMATVTI